MQIFIKDSGHATDFLPSDHTFLLSVPSNQLHHFQLHWFGSCIFFFHSKQF